MQDEFIDDQPPVGTLTPEARESLRLAMEDTPADHPDMAGFTPGPWSIDTYRPGDKDLLVSEAGVTVDIDDCTEVERAERFANARLIAASPCMLDALQAALPRLTALLGKGFSDDDVLLLGQIESAIAKATGRDAP